MQVESTSIGWSLGYMLTMSNMIPSEVKKIPPMTDPLFAGLIFLFSALTIVTVVFVFIIIIRTCYWGRTPRVGGQNPREVAHWREQEQCRSNSIKPQSLLAFPSEPLQHLNTFLSLSLRNRRLHNNNTPLL